MTVQTLPAPTEARLMGHDVPLGLFINGEWRSTGTTFGVSNPANG